MFINQKSVQFKGVSLTDLAVCETIFNVGIHVIGFQFSSKSKPVLYTIRKAENKFPKMYLGLHQNHFVAISNPGGLASLLQCDKCGRINYRKDSYDQHRKVCSGSGNLYYKTGHFTPKSTISQMIEKLGIVVHDDLLDPSVIVFDFEVGFEKMEESFSHNAEKLLFTHRHFPISVAVVSNVPGYTDGKVFVDNDPKNLIEQFISYCLDISHAAQSKFRNQIRYVFSAIRKAEMECAITNNQTLHAQVQNVEKRLISYIAKTPVVGFNSASYDLKAIKKYFFSTLEDLDEIQFCIKKDGSYLCVASENLRFLDVCKYLGPGSGGLKSP